MPGKHKSKPPRDEFTDLKKFPSDVRLRIEYAGKWVAWDLDMTQIVAATDEFETLRDAAKQAGFDRFACEWLPPLDESRFAGWA